MTTKKKINNNNNNDIDPSYIINLDELTPVKAQNNPNINDLSKIQPTKKISETKYERPLITYTDKLSKQQVKELLIDYEQIKSYNELQNIPAGTHLRYFEKKNNELKFRTGGILTVSGFPDYLILSSGHVSWSVQIKKCIFFKRITIKQIREEYNKLLHDNSATIKGLHITIKEQSSIIKQLSEENKLLRKYKKK